MKLFFLPLFFLPLQVWPQRMVLVDRNYKEPLQYTDAFSSTQLFRQQYPVCAQDIEALVKIMEQCMRFTRTTHQRGKFEHQFQAGNSRLNFSRSVRHPFAYHLTLTTEFEETLVQLLLVNREYSRKKTLQQMHAFMDYLRNNAAVLNEENTF